MATSTETEKRTICPACGRKGRRVSTVTLRSLLKDELARQFAAEDEACCAADGSTGCQPIRGDTGWRFCDGPNCDVVYFAEQGDTVYRKPDLRVAVGIKEQAGERPLCYCFGHSVESIKDELRTKGRSEALEDIRAKMKSPGCHCETANPSGACCLGSVARGIEIARAELGIAGGGAETDAADRTGDNPADDANAAAPAGSQPHKQRATASRRGELIAKLGAVISAIVASACCWLPLVLLALGVSGAGIASALEAYRPVFIVVTFAFLAAAFYFTYRPRKTAESADGCCAMPAEPADDACCQPGRRRLNMMTMNKVMLWVVTALAVAFLFFPQYVGVLVGGGDQQITADMETVVLKIDGMTCEGCAATVAEAIRSVPGVAAVRVSFQQRSAIVAVRAGQPIPLKAILAALEKAGYRGTPQSDRADTLPAPK